MMVRMLVVRGLVLALAGGLAVACTADDGEEDTTATLDTVGTGMPEPTASPQPGALNDAQIAHVVMTANTADSAAGELARSKGTGESVKAFGQRMVQDHGSANQQVSQLAQRLGIAHEESDLSRQLQTDAQSTSQRLQGLSGAEFDRAYIEHEVQMHQQVLDALDQQLIPNAQNAELRQLLEGVRPTIQSHLEQARQLQSGGGAQ